MYSLHYQICPFHSKFPQGNPFLMKACWILLKLFLCLFRCSFLEWIYVIYYIYWFTHIEPSSNFWNKANYLMVHCLLDIFLKTFVSIFNRKFGPWLALWLYLYLVLVLVQYCFIGNISSLSTLRNILRSLGDALLWRSDKFYHKPTWFYGLVRTF